MTGNPPDRMETTSKTHVIDAHMPQAVAAAIDRLREIVNAGRMTRGARLLVATAVRRAVVPRRKPGRKNPNIDSAWPDYQRGVRGLKLYQRHIPGHANMNRYHRSAEEHRLLDGLRKRASRLKEQKGTGAEPHVKTAGSYTNHEWMSYRKGHTHYRENL